MKLLKNMIAAVVLATVISSCNKTINDLQVNPNKASSVTPDLLLGTVLIDVSGTGSVGRLGGINSWDNVHKYNQYFLAAYGYYGDNQYNPMPSCVISGSDIQFNLIIQIIIVSWNIQ